MIRTPIGRSLAAAAATLSMAAGAALAAPPSVDRAELKWRLAPATSSARAEAWVVGRALAKRALAERPALEARGMPPALRLAATRNDERQRF